MRTTPVERLAISPVGATVLHTKEEGDMQAFFASGMEAASMTSGDAVDSPVNLTEGKW